MMVTPFIHVCTGHDMHPYNCDGPGKCIHCDAKLVRASKTRRGHNPARCWLCWDGDPAGPCGPLCTAHRARHRRRPS